MPDEPGGQKRVDRAAAVGWLLVAAATAVAVLAAVLAAVTLSHATVVGFPAAVTPSQATDSRGCSLIKPATVGKYLPDAASRPLTSPAVSTIQVAGCTWSSSSEGRSRTLSLVTEFWVSPASSLGNWSEISPLAIMPVIEVARPGKGVKTSSADEQVPGLGERAQATLVTVSRAGSGNPLSYELALTVSSSNADISLYMGGIPATYASVSPGNAARQAGLVAMAQDVLAALPKPAAAGTR